MWLKSLLGTRYSCWKTKCKAVPIAGSQSLSSQSPPQSAQQLDGAGGKVGFNIGCDCSANLYYETHLEKRRKVKKEGKYPSFYDSLFQSTMTVSLL